MLQAGMYALISDASQIADEDIELLKLVSFMIENATTLLPSPSLVGWSLPIPMLGLDALGE